MTQYAVPESDTAKGDWEADTGSDLFSQIDETPVSSADDTDYIYVVEDDANMADGTATFALSAITDPENNVNHFVRYRAKDSSGAWSSTPSFDVELYEGSTLIASQTHAGGGVLTSSFADYYIELSTSEADLITDYSALKLTIIMNNDGSEDSGVTVSQLFFETDDAGGGGGGGGGSVATPGGGPDSFSIGFNGFGSHFSLE